VILLALDRALPKIDVCDWTIVVVEGKIFILTAI
jgi:hypothetical protein